MMKTRNLLLISAAALALSGCAAPIIGALTLSQLSTIAGVASTITTGKGLADHALSLLTGKDCSFTEGILRKDRMICEERNSLATREDFKGVFAWLEKHKNSETAASGDQVLASYASARNQELAQAEEQKANDDRARPVTSAIASSVDLRLLTFADNDSDDMMQVATSEAGASAAPQFDSHVTLLTFRDDDMDGTPRIVSRYVYMMDPIPDSGASDPAIAVASTIPVPIGRSAVLAPPVKLAVAADRMAPAISVVPVLRPTMAMKPIPVVAGVETVASLQPAVMQQKQAESDPRPIVYWYLSGR